MQKCDTESEQWAELVDALKGVVFKEHVQAGRSAYFLGSTGTIMNPLSSAQSHHFTNAQSQIWIICPSNRGSLYCTTALFLLISCQLFPCANVYAIKTCGQISGLVPGPVSRLP